MTVVPLDGVWTLTAVRGAAPPALHGVPVPAVVPGSVHTALLADGRIDDPFDGANEQELGWIGRTVWRYRRTFDWTPPGAQRHDLVALGLDTLATVELNGQVVATTANQHRTYRFPVGHLLVEGPNTITVTFDAPVDAAERLSAQHGALPHVNHHPFNTLRKAASNFGWDWGIDVATSGIWRSMRIESWSDVRIDSVRPLVEVSGTHGVLRAAVALEHAGAATPVPVRVRVLSGGTPVAAAEAVVRGAGTVTVVVPSVRRWWPRGHGDQPLYTVEVAAGAGTWRGRVGFREVELDTSTDERGRRFALRVNGAEVSVRGANWIPDHALVGEVDPARVARRVDDAHEAGVNLLRVWGGGLYGSDDLYDRCDELGVLVWQDFLFACAAYAEEPWLADEVAAEAREVVTRLCPHPSLVLWNGNNENLWGFTDWGWRPRIGDRTWGAGYYRDVLPAIVAELDPTRPYTPGSPCSFDDHLPANGEDDGTVHIWDVWNTRGYEGYRDRRPRFVAEFGFQGPPAWTTLTDVVHDVPLDPHGPQMLVHQKAEDGNGKLERGLAGHLPAPADVHDWHFATQLNQAAALRFGVEHFRSLAPHNTGMIVWQLNDGWPVVSWSVVDFAERRKPAWYALRAAYAPRLATFQPVAGALALVLVNDTAEPFAGAVALERRDLGGALLAAASVAVGVPARSARTVPVPPVVAAAGDPAGEIVTAVPGDGFARAIWNFAEVVDQALDPDPLEATAVATPTGAVVRVTARSYVRDVVVLADRADPSATVDRSLVSLLPGESARFVLTASRPVPPAAALDPRVLRHANQLLGPTRVPPGRPSTGGAPPVHDAVPGVAGPRGPEPAGRVL